MKRSMQKQALQRSMKEVPEEGNESGIEEEDFRFEEGNHGDIEEGNQSDIEEDDIRFELSWEAWCLSHSNFEPDENLTLLKEPPSIFVIIVCWFGVALSAVETAVERFRQ